MVCDLESQFDPRTVDFEHGDSQPLHIAADIFDHILLMTFPLYDQHDITRIS